MFSYYPKENYALYNSMKELACVEDHAAKFVWTYEQATLLKAPRQEKGFKLMLSLIARPKTSYI